MREVAQLSRRQWFTSAASLGVAALGWSAVSQAAETAGGSIVWQPDLKTAHKLSVKQNKPLLILFGATWCGPCKRLQKETLSDRKLGPWIDKNFVAVHLDFDRDRKVAEILEVEQIPCTIVLNPQADLLTSFVGYMKPVDYQKKLNLALMKQVELDRDAAGAKKS